MTQEQYYLNKLSKECFKLPERPKPSNQNNNNYLHDCLKLRPGFSQTLDRKNCLSEFSMDEEKAEARSNLGITPLLEELSRQLDTRVLTLERSVVEQTPSEEEETQRNRVLSTYGLLTFLKNYYTKAIIDEELTRLRQIIADQNVVDETLDSESTNPVQNKIIKDALDGIYDVLNQKIFSDTHREQDGSIVDVHQELDNKVNLSQLDNYYNKSQIDSKLDQKVNSTELNNYYNKSEINNIDQNLRNQINNNIQELERLIQTQEYINRIASLVEIPQPISDYNNLNNKPYIQEKVSDLINDAGYITQHQSLENYYTKQETNQAIDNKFIILTESQYEALTQYEPNVIYLITEGEEETPSSGWHFGDSFPIILGGGNWSFGQNFPIILT